MIRLHWSGFVVFLVSISCYSQNANPKSQPSVQTGQIVVGGVCNPVLIDVKQQVTIQCDATGLTAKQIEEQRQEYARILTSVRQSGLKIDQILELEKQILANQKVATSDLQSQAQFDMVESWINGAERGDGRSFDQLRTVMMVSNYSQESRDAAQKEYFRIIEKYRSEKYTRGALPNLIVPPSERDLIFCIENEDATMRRQALDSADIQFIKKYLDAIFEILCNDSSLPVRDAAYRRFVEIAGTENQFWLFPDTDQIRTWWYSNRDRFATNLETMPTLFKRR